MRSISRQAVETFHAPVPAVRLSVPDAALERDRDVAGLLPGGRPTSESTGLPCANSMACHELPHTPDWSGRPDFPSVDPGEVLPELEQQSMLISCQEGTDAGPHAQTMSSPEKSEELSYKRQSESVVSLVASRCTKWSHFIVPSTLLPFYRTAETPPSSSVSFRYSNRRGAVQCVVVGVCQRGGTFSSDRKHQSQRLAFQDSRKGAHHHNESIAGRQDRR